jgi:hypothetical protein
MRSERAAAADTCVIDATAIAMELVAGHRSPLLETARERLMATVARGAGGGWALRGVMKSAVAQELLVVCDMTKWANTVKAAAASTP